MEDKKVKSVTLFFPNTEDCTQIDYEVGKSGVTKITENSYSPEPYCSKWYYEIYKGEQLFARMEHFSLVQYEQAGLSS